MASTDAKTSSGRTPLRRRARGAGDRPKKMGWQVSQSVAQAVKEAVEGGAAESQNAFVEDALLRRLKELRRERVYSAYEEAAQDPAFMQDMGTISETFGVTALDGLDRRA